MESIFRLKTRTSCSSSVLMRFVPGSSRTSLRARGDESDVWSPPLQTVALGYSKFCELFTEEEWEGFDYGYVLCLYSKSLLDF